MTENPPNREQILLDIENKNDIRNVKPEYRVVLDMLQITTPTSIQDLINDINEEYKCEMFNYKQLYDTVKSLSKINVVHINELKQISIDPNYILKSQPATIPVYQMYVLIGTVVFLMITLVFNQMIPISITALITSILCTATHLYSNR